MKDHKVKVKSKKYGLDKKEARLSLGRGDKFNNFKFKANLNNIKVRVKVNRRRGRVMNSKRLKDKVNQPNRKK